MRILAPRTLLASVALIAALSVSACTGATELNLPESSAAVETDTGTGTDTTSTATPTPVNATGGACDLLTVDVITEVTGLDYSGATITAADEFSCDWFRDAETSSDMVSVMIDPSGAASFAANKEVAQAMLGDVTDVTVEGSPQAFAYMRNLVVAMQVGDAYVVVTYVRSSAQETDPATVLALAARVVPNVG